MNARTSLVMALLLAGVAGGCVTPGGGSATSRSGALELAEIEASTARTAYELVEGLRPQWLRGRGSTSLRSPEPTLPVVYVDGAREGPPSALRRLNKASVARIEYLNSSDATTRYGTGHAGGVIRVQLRR